MFKLIYKGEETQVIFSFTVLHVYIHVYVTFSSSPGNHSDPIWLDNVECDAVESCIGSCQRCPVAADHDCRHAEDLTVSCSEYL